MGGLISTLGQLGGQYGDAKVEKQGEDFAKAKAFREMNLQDAYLQLQKQASDRQQQEFESRKKAGDLIDIGAKPYSKDGQTFKRMWSASKGGPVEIPLGPGTDSMDSIKKFIASMPKDIQPGLASRAMAISETDGDPKTVLAEVMRQADKIQGEQRTEANRKEDKQEATTQRDKEYKEREKERDKDRREQRDFTKSMVDFRLQEKAKQMTPQERQVYDSIKQIEPMVDRTVKFIEDNKLQGENDLVFGDRSALMQHLRLSGYKFGKEQEPITQQLIKDSAALQILGAAPWTRLGRSKYMYETIKTHLPAPTDTPANLYDKLTWLRDNVLADAKDSLAGYAAPDAAGKQKVDVDKVLDTLFPGK